MLICEGYKMFKGIMYVISLNKSIKGIWLYKPDTNCWYCSGTSYPVNVCKILEDDTK